MKKTTILCACLALGGCATFSTDPNYRGNDSAAVVFSMGLTGTCEGYAFEYRNTDKNAIYSQNGRIMFSAKSVRYWGRDNDFRGDERGIVNVQHLSPGTYEIYDYTIYGTYNGINNFNWKSAQKFSMQFTALPRQTVYLGDFNCVGLRAKSILGLDVDGGGYFVISDKLDRDEPIARRQDSSLGNITRAVVDAGKAGIPMLRTEFLRADKP